VFWRELFVFLCTSTFTFVPELRKFWVPIALGFLAREKNISGFVRGEGEALEVA
jgi:hypothetical protein